MTLVLTDSDVRAVFDWPAAVAALRASYAAPATETQFPARTMARGEGHWLRTLSGAGTTDGYMGAKLIAASTAHGRVSYLITLFDYRTAQLVALLDASSITGFRTAATSALAADLLASPGPLRVGVIGSGFEAQHHLRALAAVRPVIAARVYSPAPASRARFAEHLGDLGFPVTTQDSPQSATADADLVLCAARSRDETPVLHGPWLKAGSTLVSIGSTLPEQRELDTSAIERADLIVADTADEVATDTGDLIAAKEAGISFSGKLVRLEDVVQGTAAGRTGEEQIVIYKSVGAARQDLAVAAMAVRRATELGVGTPLPAAIRPVTK